MTNGEKIQTILNVDRDCTEVHGEDGTMTFTVTQDFWVSEYKEPTTKNETLVSLGAYKQVAWERDIAVEQLKELGYQLGEKVRKADDCISRQAVDELCFRFLKANSDDNCAFYEHFLDLPSVTPIRPKGHWIWCVGSHKCSNCEEYTCFSHKELLRFCPNCGADMRGTEE